MVDDLAQSAGATSRWKGEEVTPTENKVEGEEGLMNYVWPIS